MIKNSGCKLEVVWSKWKCRQFHSGKMGVDGEDEGYWICGVIEVFFSNFFLAKIWRLLNKFDCPDKRDNQILFRSLQIFARKKFEKKISMTPHIEETLSSPHHDHHYFFRTPTLIKLLNTKEYLLIKQLTWRNYFNEINESRTKKANLIFRNMPYMPG